MDNLLKRYLKGDYVIWVIYGLLVMLSIAVFFSASSSATSIIKHIVHLAFGFGALMLIYSLPKQWLKFLSWVALFASFFLLVYVYLFGQSHQGAARSIDFFGIFDLQPSEIAKFALIIVAADFIDRFQNPDYLQKNFKWFCAVGWLVLMFIVPMSLSMGIIIMLPLLLMLMIGSIPWKKIGVFFGFMLLVLGIGCLVALAIPDATYKKYEQQSSTSSAAAFAVNNLSKIRINTWVKRIENHENLAEMFKNAKTNEEKRLIINNNAQAVYSQSAIYDGRHFTAPGNSVYRNRLADAQSDYIFSIIVEEYGIYGAIFVILLFLWLLWRAGVLVKKSETIFSAIVIVGAATVVIFQAFVHIGVCTGLLPSTGQTLPLISNGGTSIIVMSAFFGLLLGMSRQAEKSKNEAVEPENNENSEKIIDEKIENIEKKTEEKSIEILGNDEIAETTEIEIN